MSKNVKVDPTKKTQLFAIGQYSVSRVQTSADVQLVMTQLEMIREAMGTNDKHVEATCLALGRARDMLGEYRDRLKRDDDEAQRARSVADSEAIEAIRDEAFKAGVASVKAKAKKAAKK